MEDDAKRYANAIRYARQDEPEGVEGGKEEELQEGKTGGFLYPSTHESCLPRLDAAKLLVLEISHSSGKEQHRITT